jgi:uncharacterized iron-regulated membrane protein
VIGVIPLHFTIEEFMSSVVQSEDQLDGPSFSQAAKDQRAKSGQVLRSVWRIHFYAAFIAVPFLLLEIITGLIILYTGPIMGVLYGDVMRVEPSSQSVALQEQRVAADTAAPEGAALEAIVTPREAGDATAFQYPQEDGTYLSVFVNPHTGDVTGTHVNGADIVGLANRLHGFLNNDSITLTLPALSHLIDQDSGPLLQEYVVGDLVLEIAAGWTLVLTLAGLFLWWPRRSQKGKALIRPRLHKKGLIRWRVVHAVSGILAIAALLLFLITGLPWSAYWGATWSTVAERVTPGEGGPFSAGAPSELAEVGDLTRYGQAIPWALQDTAIPASTAGDPHAGHSGESGSAGGEVSAAEGGVAAGTGADLPAPIDVSVVSQAASEEGMLPGYTIYLPADEVADDGTVTYGSYTLQNFWPQRLQDERTVVLDQFSGETLVDAGSGTFGGLQAATEVGITTQMGTQFGFWNTVWVTASCILLLLSIASAVAMWWIRRPAGRLGLPKRPASPGLTATIIGITVALAIIYPLWGATALLVLVMDKFVIQQVPALRRVFNMPEAS